ncbi:MAG: hypothetical protein IID31_06780 [Planctomycetes bacterium]|nr:hypothetical protein [Planctomycetota bacterium]
MNQPGPPSPRTRRHGGAIARMLGEHCALGGPFALLCITPETCDDDSIIASLDAQLTQLASHTECDTPEADEVRLALHAAAAQLLDTKVRRHLIANWRESHAAVATAPTGAPPAGRPVPRSPGRTRAQLALEHDAILTLGLYGGWNKRSLHRLVLLAHARGMDAAQVAHTLHLLSGHRRRISPVAPRNGAVRPNASRAPADESHTDTPPESPGPEFRVIALGLGIIAAMVFVIALVAVVVLLFNPRDAGPVQTGNTGGGASIAAATNPSASPRSEPIATLPRPARSELDLAEMAGRAPALIAQATRALAIDTAQAIEDFEHAVGALALAWPTVPQDTHVAARHEIIEFLYRASPHPRIGERAIASIAAGLAPLRTPGQFDDTSLWPAVWAAGMLTRLSSEKDLGGIERQRIAAELIAALRERRVVRDPTFRAGALAALNAMTDARPSETGRTPFPWDRWADAAHALSRSNPRAREALLLDALETVLVDAPEPNDDKYVFDAIRLLAHRIKWRSGDESRRRLLAWFLDERVSSADLHALTSTLARESSAPGVDVTMILPLLASDQVRSQLRGRFATAWGMTAGVDRRTVAAELAAAARDAMADLPSDATRADLLRRTVRLSRLNEAVGWAWKGRSQEADELLAALDDSLDGSAASTPTRNAPGPVPHTPADAGSGTSWAERYLAAKNRVPMRLDLLEQLDSMKIPDAVAAELLVHDALRGTPARVRQRAQEVVRSHVTNAAVTNAALEQLPLMPRTNDNARLIEAITFAVLPAVSSDEWRLQARRALVETLLQRLSAQGDLAGLDDYVDQLALSYVGRSSRSPLVGPDRENIVPLDPGFAASMLFRQWRASVDRAVAQGASAIDTDAVDRRRTGRLGLATGPVQQFAAHQASLCEVMAVVIASERPEAAARIRALMDDMTDQRRRAIDIYRQIHAVERSMLELWLMRIGEANL